MRYFSSYSSRKIARRASSSVKSRALELLGSPLQPLVAKRMDRIFPALGFSQYEMYNWHILLFCFAGRFIAKKLAHPTDPFEKFVRNGEFNVVFTLIRFFCMRDFFRLWWRKLAGLSESRAEPLRCIQPGQIRHDNTE